MSSSSGEKELKVLSHYEGKLVGVLKKRDLKCFCEDLYEKVIISKEIKDKFASLDHGRLKAEVMVRYLLQQVYDAVKDNKLVYNIFFDVLCELDRGVAGELRRELHYYELVDIVGESQTSQSDELVSVKRSRAHYDIGDYRFCEEDVPLLTELLNLRSDRVKHLGVSLYLRPSQFLKDDSGTIALTNILQEWIRSSRETCTLKRLKEALASELVGMNKLAHELEERFVHKSTAQVSKRQCLNRELHPIYHSSDTKVASGKSALLGFQVASTDPVYYQWFKNDLVLAESVVYSGTCSGILFIGCVSKETEGHYSCRVHSSIGSVKLMSERIYLSISWPEITEKILKIYSRMNNIPKDSWPPVTNTEFISLELISKNKNANSDYDYVVSGDIDDIIAAKEHVECKEVFGKYESGALLLVEGCPGSGKTTLMHKVTRDWATKGNMLLGADIVILVPPELLLVGTNKDITLSNIFEKYIENDDERSRFIEKIKTNGGDGTCIIFDGLENYECSNSTMIYKIIHKHILPLAMIIVASRPVDISSVRYTAPVTKYIEVVGFTKESLFNYIDSYSTENNFPCKLKSYLHLHINLLHICYLPVHAAMLCFLYSELGDNIPQTETKMYESLTILILQRNLTRENRQARLVTSLHCLSGKIREYFINICNLAFDMTIHSKQVVRESQTRFPLATPGSDKSCLGLLTIDSIAGLLGMEYQYTFLHLTFQEYLAAFYLIELCNDEIQVITEDKHINLQVVLKFFCGMVNFKDHTLVFERIMSDTKTDILYKIQCAFESQQQIVCDSVLEHERTDTLSFKDRYLMQTDFLAISYVISATRYTLTALTFTDCTLTEEGVALFLEKIGSLHLNRIKCLGYHKKNCTIQQFVCLNLLLKKLTCLEILDLQPTELGVLGVKKLTENLELPQLQTLKFELPLKKNKDNDVDILKQLKCKSTRLEQIHYGCLKKISSSENHKLILMLLEAFRNVVCYNSNDQIFYYCNITLQSIPLMETFQWCSKVFLINCGITDNESNLLESIISREVLDTLHLDFNRITGIGAKLLSAYLEKCTKLEVLSAHCNQIDDSGALAIVNALVQLNNPKILDLQGNPITKDGACALIMTVKDVNVDFQLYVTTDNSNSLDESKLALVQQSVDIICKSDTLEAACRALKCCMFLPESRMSSVISNVNSLMDKGKCGGTI